jgi:hypothetical protein
MQRPASLAATELGKAMEFTEEGLRLVKTMEFAQMVDGYLSPWREQGVSESGLTKLLAAVVAWAAAGQAINKPPIGRQSYELTAFTLSHLTDIDNLSSHVIENILGLRTPQQSRASDL